MSDELSYLIPALVPFLAVVGLLIGSFLNVVIYRVPAAMSVVSPRSSCPKCETPIRARDNVPVLSWLLLRGKCRDCGEPISARYPAVELSTALLFAGVSWWTLHHVPALTPLFLYLTAAGVALFMIDIDVKRLPDAIVYPSYPIVAALLVLGGFLSGEWPVARVGLSALVWLLTFGIPWLVTTGRGMGFGDVKLAPLLGASLGAVGWGESIVGLFGGFAVAAVISILLLVAKIGGRKIPYGPYMLGGALLGLVAGDAVWHWYLVTMGLAV